MKKLVLFFFGTVLITSCSSTKEECKCEGKFKRINNPGYFLSLDVDCQTGQPALNIQNQGTIGTTNPAIYLGCNK